MVLTGFNCTSFPSSPSQNLGMLDKRIQVTSNGEDWAFFSRHLQNLSQRNEYVLSVMIRNVPIGNSEANVITPAADYILEEETIQESKFFTCPLPTD